MWEPLIWPLAIGPTVWMTSVNAKGRKNRISKVFFTFYIIGALFTLGIYMELGDKQTKKY